ncbi:acetyl-coA hydrolase [Heterostelium album PN500]|uniref:Acetyl-CoA hydrolase n=1 Tax=Heterostelium pallidum (strain ATCC 26659 / Pp 5 / PN500) TaxID=670386 RepID=D3BTR1_HETP5|nr:acetyl-coA hydrolase [Heterostelium album PN500]EFA75097.1 acetyl-coA hydrolase [Heterostelium album PN500]|eukprot:XP_020427231.1 acetyl-coA hydrolase [Heterostelium album PN500]
MKNSQINMMNNFINTGKNSVLKSRIGRKSLHRKIVNDLDDIIPLFQNGQYLGWSGFAGTNYPKVIPIALANHVEQNELQGKMKFNLFVGASTGQETEDRWAALDMISRRYPHQVGKNIQKGINSGRIKFADGHLSTFANDITYGYYTMNKPKGGNSMDIVIIEATEITEQGWIIPGASVGIAPELIQMADKIIVELNTSMPSYRGVHDIVSIDQPPHTKPFQITRVDDRIGYPAIPCDPEKIVAIIESQLPDSTPASVPADAVSKSIANHIVEFLKREISKGFLPKNLLPLQSGIGNIANAVIGGIHNGPFDNINVWTEVIQDTFLDFFESGKLNFASTTSIRFSQSGFNRLFNNWKSYSTKFVLRNQSISNSAEMIRRLGVISMNTPVEFDIYGHANSTCVAGSRMLNGIGGSGEFNRNSKLAIMHAPSVRPSKTDPLGVSTIVPFCTHVDHTEHDVDIYVTEQGLADLRGLSPTERAVSIIENCAHPVYKPILMDYFKSSQEICLKNGSAHEPHQIDKCFKMHTNLNEKGTMRIDSW